MAKMLGWLVVIGILLMLFFYVWGSVKERNAPPATPPPVALSYSTPGPYIPPPPTPVPGWVPPASRQAAQPANPAGGIQVPSRAHLTLQSQGMDWQGMAREAGCEMTGFSREGNLQVITLEAPSHSNFGRFLDAAMRTGRLKDPGPANMQQFTKNGRVMYRTTYRLQLN